MKKRWFVHFAEKDRFDGHYFNRTEVEVESRKAAHAYAKDFCKLFPGTEYYVTWQPAEA